MPLQGDSTMRRPQIKDELEELSPWRTLEQPSTVLHAAAKYYNICDIIW
jgi:hypothetical protein